MMPLVHIVVSHSSEKILNKGVLTKQIDQLRNTLKGKLYFTWFFYRLSLNVAYLSARNLNYKGKARLFGLVAVSFQMPWLLWKKL